MATRLYGVANTAAPISLPNPDVGWQSTTGFVRRSLSKTKAAATETRAAVVVASGAGNETLGFQLISDPLAAQTISGTVTIVARWRELALTDNLQARVRGIRVVSNDGSTVRGTLLALGNHSVSTEPTVTTLAGFPFANATAITTVNAQAGDRIVVELGLGMTTTGTSPQYDMVIGGSGTDHSTAEQDTTGTVPWIEFSANLVFLQTIDGTRNITVNRSANASVAFAGGQELIAVYGVDSGGAADGSTLTTPAFSPDVGEIVVVKGATWDQGVTLQTPDDGGLLTYTLRKSVSVVNKCWVAVWTAEVTSAPGVMTISTTPVGSAMHSMVVERWGNADLAATPAVNGSPDNGGGGTSAPSSPITTTGTNSIVTWVNGDWQAASPSGRVYLGVTTEDYLYDQSAGVNTVQYHAYTKVAAPGTTSLGLSTPSNQGWSLAAVEIKSLAAGATVTIDGDLDVTATLTATADVIPAAVTVAGSVAVTANRTATAQAANSVSGSLGATANRTAAGTGVHPVTGSLALTASLVGAIVRAQELSGARTVTFTGTADTVRIKTVDAALAISVDVNATADIKGQLTVIGALDITTGLAADLPATKSTTAAGLTVNATATASVVKSKDIAGSLVVTESATTAGQAVKNAFAALTVSVGTSAAAKAVRTILGALGITAEILSDADTINIARPPDFIIVHRDDSYVISQQTVAYTITESTEIDDAIQPSNLIIAIRGDDTVT